MEESAAAAALETSQPSDGAVAVFRIHQQRQRAREVAAVKPRQPCRRKGRCGRRRRWWKRFKVWWTVGLQTIVLGRMRYSHFC
ncbi:hypothetical protein KCP74_01710 [Salmonella enterica subsp. enterica]|nr:hypothetical protein KCP74_01710 [Salmonella enterica subsp. enterica]